jgi:hypothetical protein
MRSLDGVRVAETLTSGARRPTEKIAYRLSSPDRMAYSLSNGAGVVIIGKTMWSSDSGREWQRGSYGSASFSTSSWYEWQQYDQSIQLLDERDVGGQRSADIALMSPTLPVWFQLHIDLSSGRVSRVGMIAGGHFMTDNYSAYGAPERIAPPTG